MLKIVLYREQHHHMKRDLSALGFKKANYQTHQIPERLHYADDSTAIRRLTKLALFLGVLMICSTACQSSLPHCPTAIVKHVPDQDITTLTSEHVLSVNADGFLENLLQNSRIIKKRDELNAYLEQTVWQGFKNSGKQKILIFVHGGLNAKAQGIAHFRANYQEILSGDYYPVFIVWPSGLGETYVEHLVSVRQGVKAETSGEKTFSYLTVPFVFFADLGRAITRLPLVDATSWRSDVETVTPIRDREGGAAVRQYQDLVRDNYNIAIGDDYSRRSDRFGRGVSYWLTFPLKAIDASFIDGFGTVAWDDMLRRTQEVYPSKSDVGTLARTESLLADATRPESVTTSAQKTTKTMSAHQQRRAEHYAGAGVPAFLEMLADAQSKDANLEVTGVGHSMGTIILNRVLADTDVKFKNIVYMGAACSIADFSSSALPYIREHTNAQFYNLSLHPVAEAGEWNALDLVPRGSLLVWIDNFLSNPVTEQERTMGRWRNLFRGSPTGEPIIRRFFDGPDQASLKQRLHFEGFSVGFGDKTQIRDIKFQWNENPNLKDRKERCDNPLSHGEFSEMPYWSSDFWWRPGIIAGGKAHQIAP
jgi:pimeloyl-ACP methyl ester carboxylesterase